MARSKKIPIKLNAHQASLLFIGLMLGIYGLFFLKTVLIPFVVGFFLFTVFQPVAQFFKNKLGLHWAFSYFTTVILLGLLIWLIGYLVSLSIADLTANFPAYMEKLGEILYTLSNGRIGPTEQALLTSTLQSNLDEILAQNIFMLGEIFAYTLLVLLYTFFFLLEQNSPEKMPAIYHVINAQTRKYLVLKTLISIGTALPFGLVLWAFDVPLAFVFGLLAFFFNFIPNIGPIVASLLPLPVLLVNPEMSLSTGILVFFICATIQGISGNVVEIKIMGNSFDISSVMLMLALMFWGFIWGIPGLFLAPVITFMMKTFLDHYQLKFSP